ncbi:MAG: lysostaphin resistance A-like protein [Candidatus Thorarchaeota archaeon]
MTLITDNGDIRFIWKIILALILNLLLIVISRLLLIFIVEQVFILQGANPDFAFEDAQFFVSESSEGQAIAGSLDLLLIFLLVFFLVNRIEKRDFHLEELGLNLQRNTIPFVVLGVLLASLFFLGAIAIGILLGTVVFPLLPSFDQWPLASSFAAAILFFAVNSFWQEILFRGYLQTRAVNEYGRAIGVTGVALVFVLFHGLVQTLTPISILTGMLLFVFIGLLYDKTRSLYLVGAFHAVLNFLPGLFDISWQGFEAATIYGIALLLLVLLLHRKERGLQSVDRTS